MSAFLLLAERPEGHPEMSPAGTARMLTFLSRWHNCLARWGLRDGVAVHDDAAVCAAAAILVRVSSAEAASGLANTWAQLGGCQVTVLRMTVTRQAATPDV